MKHGDKGKSKAAGKASGKKTVKASKSSKVAKAVKGSHSSAKKTGSTSAKAAAGNGKGRGRGSDEAAFTNPLIAAAFKRAVRKYPNAFRKLTD